MSKNILIIEDDLQIRRSIEAEFELYEMESDTEFIMFEDGNKALAFIEDNKDNVMSSVVAISVDNDLGPSSPKGTEIIKIIRSIFDGPIIMVTSDKSIKTVKEVLQAGADDYITKEDDFESKLVKYIKNAAGYRRNKYFDKDIPDLHDGQFFSSNLSECMGRVKRLGSMIAIILFDIGEGPYNCDHQSQIFLLKKAAEAIEEIVGKSSLLFRSGKEIRIIVSDVKSERALSEIISRLVDFFENPLDLDGDNKIKLNYVIKTNTYPITTIHDGQRNYSISDKALTDGAFRVTGLTKEETSQAISSSSKSLVDSIRGSMMTTRILRKTLEKKQLEYFVACFQPRQCIHATKGYKTSRFSSVNCSIFWRYKKPITQEYLISLFGDSLWIINEVNFYALSKACETARKFFEQRDVFSEFTDVKKINVRLTHHTLRMGTKNLCDRIEKIVKTSGTTNDWWSFTLGMEDFKAGGEKIISDNMKALSEMGFSWTICDVQPKNLDISYFNDLPISTITISRQLIYKLPDTHKTIRAILDVAKVFDMRVIADGIETPEQIKIINSINIESEQNKTHLTASGKIHEMSGKIIIPLCSFDDLVKILYKRKQLDVEKTIGRG